MTGILLLLMGGAVMASAGPQQEPALVRPARHLPASVARPQVLSPSRPGTVVRRIDVLRGKTSVEVRIEGTGPLKAVSRVLSNPERIVVDLADVSYDRTRRLPVNLWDLEWVRVGMFQDNPPITRVVLDMKRPHVYRVLPAGNTVIVQIEAKLAEAAPGPVAPQGQLVQASHAPESQPASTPQARPETQAQNPASPQPLEPQAPVVSGEATQRTTAPSTEAALSTRLPQVATILPTNAASNERNSPVPVEDETTPHQAAKAAKPGLIRSLAVSREKNAIEVHIQGSKPLHPAASTLSSPERIVIDLADVRLVRPRQIPVNAGDVQNVDASLYLVNPLVTRVVVNLARPHAYHLLTSGNSLTVRIETEEVKTAEKPAQ